MTEQKPRDPAQIEREINALQAVVNAWNMASQEPMIDRTDLLRWATSGHINLHHAVYMLTEQKAEIARLRAAIREALKELGEYDYEDVYFVLKNALGDETAK